MHVANMPRAACRGRRRSLPWVTLRKGGRMSRLFRSLAVGAVVLTLLATVSLSSVGAVTTYSLTPFTYVGKAGDCGAGTPAGTPGGVIARWDTKAGNPAPSLLLA